MAKFKFSTHYKAVQSRLRRLPKLVNDAMDSSTKKDVANVISIYQDGMRKDNFNLAPLQPRTIRKKIRQGMPKPKVPLYGKGDTAKNTLINALAIRKIKKGYRLYRRRAKHWKANMSLKDLLSIHEHGAVIKNGFGRGIFIRIPPRPVVDLAIKRMLREKKKGEPSISIRSAINELINRGNQSQFDKIKSFNERLANALSD